MDMACRASRAALPPATRRAVAVRPAGEVLNWVRLVGQTLGDCPEQALEPWGVRVAVTCKAVNHQASGVRTGTI